MLSFVILPIYHYLSIHGESSQLDFLCESITCHYYPTDVPKKGQMVQKQHNYFWAITTHKNIQKILLITIKSNTDKHAAMEVKVISSEADMP